MHFATLSLLISAASAGVLSRAQTTGVPDPVCLKIAGSIAGNVYYNPGNTTADDTTPNPFTTAITHWMTSSAKTPLCVVEVKDAADISAAIKIIGSTKTPFAVKSGGYNGNPGFSSTTGIQISLAQLKMVKISQDRLTVEVGTGNSFTEVYKALNGSGVVVLGARADGPGVGGVTLACGYSWYTNQYGLACDTVQSYEVILPNGKIVTASKSSEPDLFFALKGGVNRFGIVAKIVFKAIPQLPKIYGGLQIFPAESVPAVLNATQYFNDNSRDPRASIILTITGGPNAIVLYFYDGPNRPSDFDPFNGIASDLSTLATTDYATLIGASFTSYQAGNRGTFATFSVNKITRSFMDILVKETEYWSKFTESKHGGLFQYEVQTFHKYGKFATDSAYPHCDSPIPIGLYFSWVEAADDAFWNDAVRQSLAKLTGIAKKAGILNAGSAYPGYALAETTGDQLYGKINAERLRKIRAVYDPQGVMLLSGGFKI